MWKALQHAGFTGGRVLEPGCGAGTFIGLAPETAQMVGVEKDPISAAIAAYLYPTAQVRAEGYETTNVPNGSFAAVIGNVPFGNFALRDPAYNPRRLSIHNHFIVKSLDLTAPGGYQIVLTSRFTMDNADPKARREILSAPTCSEQYACPPTLSGVSRAPQWSPTFSCCVAAKPTGLSKPVLTTGYTLHR